MSGPSRVMVQGPKSFTGLAVGGTYAGRVLTAPSSLMQLVQNMPAPSTADLGSMVPQQVPMEVYKHQVCHWRDDSLGTFEEQGLWVLQPYQLPWAIKQLAVAYAASSPNAPKRDHKILLNALDAIKDLGFRSMGDGRQIAEEALHRYWRSAK